MRNYFKFLVAAVAVALVVTPASAVEYVKICTSYGEGWAYIPGTPVCYNIQTGETREQTDDGVVYGQLPLANSAEANEGVAVSTALPNATVDPGKTFGIAVNFGTFEGESALGLGAAMQVGGGLTLNGAIGAGTTHGTVAGRVGANFSW